MYKPVFSGNLFNWPSVDVGNCNCDLEASGVSCLFCRRLTFLCISFPAFFLSISHVNGVNAHQNEWAVYLCQFDSCTELRRQNQRSTQPLGPQDLETRFDHSTKSGSGEISHHAL